MAKQKAPTIYDHIDFPDYKYREFPLMMYHPLARMNGTGSNRQIESLQVNNEAEQEELASRGWHDHPSKAMAAAEAAKTAEPVGTAGTPKAAEELEKARALLLANGIDPDTGKQIKPQGGESAPKPDAAKPLTLADLQKKQ